MKKINKKYKNKKITHLLNKYLLNTSEQQQNDGQQIAANDAVLYFLMLFFLYTITIKYRF